MKMIKVAAITIVLIVAAYFGANAVFEHRRTSDAKTSAVPAVADAPTAQSAPETAPLPQASTQRYELPVSNAVGRSPPQSGNETRE